MKRLVKVATVAILSTGVPAWALFGIGDIVHDPISYINAVAMYGQLVAGNELAAFMAKVVPVDMLTRYRVPEASWYGLKLAYDRFDNLSGWLQAVNAGGSALAAYNKASVELRSYGPGFSRLAAEEQVKTASQYASAELADGTNVDSMETVGMLRKNASAEERAIQNLEDDALSLDPAMNTEVAVLNKINAASVAALRSSRDTNRALLSVLQQQIVESKARRDALASEINFQITRMEQGDQEKAARTSTITESIRNFRWGK